MLHKFTVPREIRSIHWAYGITTITDRLHTLLPRTIASLKGAGFDDPRLFIDGVGYELYNGLRTTVRYPEVKSVGNWFLGLLELYIRNPFADYYVMFQDDLVTYKNLRQYLETTQHHLPSNGYFNLFTYPDNVPSSKAVGWHLTNQRGLGALALLFPSQVVLHLLSSRIAVEKHQHPTRSKCSLDGCIVTAMKVYGIKEYCHYPSLVQHTGQVSTMGGSSSSGSLIGGFQSDCFWEEEFDALELVPKVTEPKVVEPKVVDKNAECSTTIENKI